MASAIRGLDCGTHEVLVEAPGLSQPLDDLEKEFVERRETMRGRSK